MSLLLIVGAPFALAPFLLLADRLGRNAVALLGGLAALCSFILTLGLAPSVLSGVVLHESWSWLPALGLELHLRMDGLGLLFAGLVSGIGLLILLYARFYLSAEDAFARFFFFLLLFMGSMLGVVLSGNILLLVVFWELTSISSFLLIGYWHDQADARQGARMALTVTGLGGLALMGGAILLGRIAGGFDLDTILGAGPRIAAHPYYHAALILVFLGAATKSAQFPFHFWLPHAMAAPTPVSAYLHSATMVKAGVFLLARLHPALSGHSSWVVLVTSTGLVTAILAAYWAIKQDDLKGLLAYSTISHLGLITALFGLGTTAAAYAGVFHILNHAIFKAALFMTAGIVDHETGTRDLKLLGGLRHSLPRMMLLSVFAGAAMAGIPPLNGFLSKELFFEATLQAGDLHPWLVFAPYFALGAGLFGIAYTLRFVLGTFFGKQGHTPHHGHEPPWPMRLPVEILTALALLIGLAPFLFQPIVASAGFATSARSLDLHLSLWHGFTMPLAMSGAALLGGLLFFLIWRRWFAVQSIILPRIQARAFFDKVILYAVRGSRYLSELLDGLSFRRYALYTFFLLIMALWMAFPGDFFRGGSRPPLAADPASVVAWLLLVVAAFVSVRWYRHRLQAIISLSVIGLIVILTFERFSAPDLALTQLSVEVVTLLLLLLALNVLPEEAPTERGHARALRDFVLAVLAGGGTAGIVWSILTRPHESTSAYHLQNSISGGGGANVVNVTLVDFRGFDTMGEISVLGIAALAIYGLFQGMKAVLPDQAVHRAHDKHPLILTAITRPLLPVALAVALYVFLRGHNAPGGGFIAGLIASVALVVQFVAGGNEWAHARLRLPFAILIASGLILAFSTGAGSLAIGFPFLTSAFAHVHWPVVGEFEVATAMLFDTGVFLVVVGTTMLILTELGRLYRPGNDDELGKERNPWKP